MNYAMMRRHLLHVCKGYGRGTTCVSKRAAQRNLVVLRQSRALGLI